MALSPGTRLGPYEVTAQIGVGGMGEVYRATDTNLKRAVAIKVLPESVAADAERLARFQREAEVLASLNHPHIAAIYGLERSEGTTALVMELVEGPTLADRVAQGPISVDETLPIAKQIAEALEAAHERGIIHRDFKPANIKVRLDRTVKVLDFGLAKAMDPVGSAPTVTQSPTITSPAMMTAVGIILGTAAYMSPEQARGKAADKRSDVWAFGCVLYEMLTAKRAFEGELISDVSARGNDTGTLYWQAADGTSAAERLTTSPAVLFPTSVSPDGNRLVLFGNGLSGGRSFGLSLVTLSGSLPSPAGGRLEPTSLLESSTDQQDGEISPDGRWIAYQSNESGRFEVYLRPFPNPAAGRVPISPGGGTRPAWARNARELFYLDADGYLTTVPVQTAGTTLIAGKPTRLFTTRYYAGLSPRGRDLPEYDVPNDAQRFLMIKNEGNEDRFGFTGTYRCRPQLGRGVEAFDCDEVTVPSALSRDGQEVLSGKSRSAEESRDPEVRSSPRRLSWVTLSEARTRRRCG